MRKEKKIFIAGHKGLLGASLVDEFKKDNFYKIITISKKSLDLRNFEKINLFIKKNRIEYVINAAGLVGGIAKNINNQIEFLDDNYLIQSNLIKASYKNNIKKYINIASSCIYPADCKQPLKEDYLMSGKLEKTNEGYALAKLCGIKLAEFYNEKYNFNSLSVIPCNLYGANDDYFDDSSHFVSGIISKIYLAKIYKKKSVILWGSGKPRREIMLNLDSARAIKFCLEEKIKEKNINIGTGVDCTIKQYANKIKKALCYKGTIGWDKSKADGIKRKLLDISKLKKYNFVNQYNTDDGLAYVINKFLKERN